MTIRGTHRPHIVPITAPSFPAPPQPHIYRKIAYTFAAFTVCIVLAVVWLSSVRAEVNVKVKRSSIKLDGTVEIAKNPAPGQIAGRVVGGIFDSGIQEFVVKPPAVPTSTIKTEPVIKKEQEKTSNQLAAAVSNDNVVARGTVRIINKYSRAQTLVKTTRLLTADGKLYRIDKTINVPSKGEVMVSAYADKLGSIYAIGPTRFTIPGLWIDLQKFIYAVSDESFIATPDTSINSRPHEADIQQQKLPVTAEQKAIVTEQNIRDAENALKDAAFEQAKKTLAAEVNDSKLSGVVYFTRLIEKRVSVRAGETAEKFLASVKLDVTAVYYPQDDMAALIRSRLKEKIPEGREFLPFSSSSVAYSLESADTKFENSTVHLIADAEYRLTTESPALLKTVMAGKTKTEVEAALKALDGVEDAQVVMHPRWMSKIPTLKDHIEVKVQ